MAVSRGYPQQKPALSRKSWELHANASPAAARRWEARSLALHHLATRDQAEAIKVMETARGRSSPAYPSDEPAAHRSEGDKMISTTDITQAPRRLSALPLQFGPGLRNDTAPIHQHNPS